MVLTPLFNAEVEYLKDRIRELERRIARVVVERDTARIEVMRLKAHTVEHPYHEACPHCWARYQSVVKERDEIKKIASDALDDVEIIKREIERARSGVAAQEGA